jgi:hypothetical protein
MDFEIPPKENQTFSEGNPNRIGRKSKENGKEIQINSFHFFGRIEPFQGLTPTPAGFFLFEPLPASEGRGSAGVPV